jgi:hypothetical protein
LPRGYAVIDAQRVKDTKDQGENMRKLLFLALASVGALAVAGIAYGAVNTQTITAKVSPKKLPKTSKAPVSLSVNVVSTNPANAGGTPNATTLAEIDFDKDIKIQQKGFPTCDPSQFGSQTTTQDVKAACPDAILGTGTATVHLGPLQVHADAIGANVKGNKILLLAYAQETGAVPLVGSIVKSKGGSKYGQELSVPVPPLAGGAGVITQFGLNVKKLAYQFHGKKLGYVSSSCKDKKVQFQARFTDGQGQVAIGDSTQKCKQKNS